MVVTPYYSCTSPVWCTYCIYKRICRSTIYLHLILMGTLKNKMYRERNLETILTISTGLAILYLIFDIKLLLFIAIGFSIVGLFINSISGKITSLWLKLAMLLGAINSKIILSIVFFVILVPISYFYRLFNKDAMQLKRNKEKSYYYEREHEFSPEDFKNIW